MKKITKLIALFVAFGLLSSCLKDDKYALDPSGGNNVVEFYNVTAPISTYNDKYVIYIPMTLEAVEEAEFTVGVNYAGPENVAPQDIVIELAASPETVEDNNTVEGSSYTQLDPSLYEFPTTVTIPKGEKTALFQVKVKPLEFNGDLNNALGIRITSSSYGVISGNIGEVIFSLPVKNIYDGVYAVEEIAPMSDVVASNLVGYYPFDAELRTLNGSSVVMFDYLIGNNGHLIFDNVAQGLSYYGNFAPVFHFDEEHNVVDVTNYFGQGTNSSARAARLDPTGVNKFTINEDGSRVLEVNYVMVQGGTDRTFYSERWVFTGTREE
ncbi:DUF1735 domain-containing protein [Parapedobacter sp. DT-150]|uniref:DUF1735 domain-containing protein n=1 Tax=Parapedobacter sp. DT-150 TaxID=3396162 RepID=UPI003F1AE91D